jgi:hypothetical protein
MAAVQSAALEFLPTHAPVMIVRAVHGARANLLAARLTHKIGVRRFVVLAVPIITLATRITGGEASGPAGRAAGDGSTPSVVGHGFIETLGSKAGFPHRQ